MTTLTPLNLVKEETDLGSSLSALWQTNKGSQEICIAILDGPVDTSHDCFVGAQLTAINTVKKGEADRGPACSHGTHVASIIFGQHHGDVKGIAPGCRGLLLPIYEESPSGAVMPSSQLDLARAILQAVQQGAHIINISGGQLAPSGAADPVLENAIHYCEQKNVLIVAAAGNDGCNCLHVPASVKSVLAVGALDNDNNPLDSSNWGKTYQSQGIMAPGKDIPGALPGGGVGVKSGTSFATPIVAGIAALLLSEQVMRGEQPNPHAIRKALLDGATPCSLKSADVCRRLLKGTLNLPKTQTLIRSGETPMDNEIAVADVELPADSELAPGLTPSQSSEPLELPAFENTADEPVGITASGSCESCSGGNKSPQLVYALGSLGFDFGTEARRDSFIQAMPAGRNNPHVPEDLLDYLKQNPFEASSITWTLNVDATPVYAIVPVGPYANVGYERLVETIGAMIDGSVELASIPGIVGGSVRLLSGQTVPAIIPAVRGMYGWAMKAMVASALGERPSSTGAKQTDYDKSANGLSNFLSRIYYDMRNLGMTSEERALNYSATNAFQASQVIMATTKNSLDLDRIDVRKSPVCRPDSDCWDVELHFFNPQNTNVANQVHRFTVDVSDQIPVTIGAIRSFSRR